MELLTELELRALSNSLIISFFVGLFTVGASSILVYFFTFYKIAGKKILSMLLLLPLFIPPFLIAFSWMHVLRFFGDKLLFGLNWRSISLLQTIPGSTFLLVLSLFPIPFFLLSYAFKRIPASIIEAATLVASEKKAIRKIAFGMTLPSILIAFLLTFIITFITFDVPAFLNVRVLVMEIFNQYTFSTQWQRGIYLSFVPVFVTGIVWILLLFQYVRGKTFFSTREFQSSEIPKKSISRTGTVLIIGSIVLYVFLTLAPLVFLHIQGAFFENIVYDTESSKDALINTLGIGIVGSTILVFLSLILYFFVYRKGWGRIGLLSLFIVPSITFGIIFILIFNRPFLNFVYATPFILIAAFCLRFAPIICEIMYANTRNINIQLLEAARLLPVSRIQKVKRIVFPLYKPTILLVWVFSFWFIVTELPITLLIQPAGFQTVMSRLFILLHYGAVEKMSELTLALVFISLLSVAGVKYVLGSKKV